MSRRSNLAGKYTSSEIPALLEDNFLLIYNMFLRTSTLLLPFFFRHRIALTHCRMRWRQLLRWLSPMLPDHLPSTSYSSAPFLANYHQSAHSPYVAQRTNVQKLFTTQFKAYLT